MGKIGLLIELIGFVMVVFFAGVLLERGVTKTLSKKVEEIIFSFAINLDRIPSLLFTIPLLDKYEFSFLRDVPLSSIKEKRIAELLKEPIIGLSLLIIISLPIGIPVVGWIKNIQWLFWISTIYLIVTYIFGSFEFFGLLKYESRRFQKTLMWLVVFCPVIFHLGVIITYAIWFSGAIVVLLALYTLRVMQTTLILLSGRDTLKTTLLVIGAITAIIGLILQYIASL